MISTHAAPNVIIPSNALPQVQQHRSRWVGVSQSLKIRHDFLRQNGRAVTFSLSERLGVVWFIAMHPTDNRWIVLVLKPAGLAADDGKTRVTQLRELIGSRPAIKPYVEIDPHSLEARRIRRILEP